MKQKTVLLLGSYGQSNLGDDLLMWNYLEFLRERNFTKIYVNANTTELIPEPIKKQYPGLTVVDTYQTSLVDYLKLIRSVDCIVYGGGTLYKELYVSTGRSKYSVIIRMMGFNIVARLHGTPVYHLNIGIGSLPSRLGKFITKRALMAATKTIFRDKKSYHIARRTLHVPEAKIQLSTDGLFLNHIWEKPWHKSKLTINTKKYKKIIGINILSDIPDWVDRAEYIATMRRYVEAALGAGNYVIFMPFQHAFNPHNDHAFMQDVFADVLKHPNCQLLGDVPIDQISAALRECDVFIGMRFHSLLLATVNQVPFVAVAYDTKCWRFIEENNYPYAVKLEDVESSELTRLQNDALADAHLKAQLKTISHTLYSEAEEGIRTLHL